jgi:predicted nucleic acid-binding Zn ribbon protein
MFYKKNKKMVRIFSVLIIAIIVLAMVLTMVLPYII